MEIPDVNLLMDYWSESPPVHVLVAGYMGIGKKKEGEKGTMTAEQFAAMLGVKIPRPPAATPSLVVPAIPQTGGPDV